MTRDLVISKLLKRIGERPKRPTAVWLEGRLLTGWASEHMSPEARQIRKLTRLKGKRNFVDELMLS